MPVFVDVEADSYTMDPAALEAAITPRTQAVIPVHIAGLPADMDRILDLARRHGLAVIEDACQAHGAAWKGRRVGALGDLGCASASSPRRTSTRGGGRHRHRPTGSRREGLVGAQLRAGARW